MIYIIYTYVDIDIHTGNVLELLEQNSNFCRLFDFCIFPSLLVSTDQTSSAAGLSDCFYIIFRGKTICFPHLFRCLPVLVILIAA